MPKTVTRFHTDASIEQGAPRKHHGKGERLWVRSTGSNAGWRSLLMAAKPFPHNDALQVITATLQLYVRDPNAWNGSTQIVVERIQEQWRENRTNWNGQPNTTNDGPTFTITDPELGELIELDVTSRLKAVAAGADWYGLELRSLRDKRLS